MGGCGALSLPQTSINTVNVRTKQKGTEQNKIFINQFILINKDFERILFNLLDRADYENKPRKYVREDGSIYQVIDIFAHASGVGHSMASSVARPGEGLRQLHNAHF